MLSFQSFRCEHCTHSQGEITRVTQRKNIPGGFTLIELMIVVVVLGILAAIALPSYARYVERTHIADGQVALLDAAQWVERQYTVNNAYPDTLPAALVGASDFYNLALASAGQDYTLTAQATSNKRGTNCNTMTLNHFGARTPETGCWR